MKRQVRPRTNDSGKAGIKRLRRLGVKTWPRVSKRDIIFSLATVFPYTRFPI